MSAGEFRTSRHAFGVSAKYLEAASATYHYNCGRVATGFKLALRLPRSPTCTKIPNHPQLSQFHPCQVLRTGCLNETLKLTATEHALNGNRYCCSSTEIAGSGVEQLLSGSTNFQALNERFPALSPVQ
jgi:hypothetical protein